MSKRPKPEVVKPPAGSRRPRREPQTTNRPYAKDRCPASGKRRFRDHREAVAALHRIANHRKTAREHNQESRRRELRCYRCKECRGWHLTSKPPGPKRQKKKTDRGRRSEDRSTAAPDRETAKGETADSGAAG